MTDADPQIDFEKSDVLIVDDNAQNAELIEAYLEPLGYNMRIAVDGVDALEKIQQHIPDIILLDIMMPRMSGYEVCRRVKSDPKTKDVSVLIVTALNEISDVERAVDCGADDFLSKPVNKLELLVRVKSLLKVRHLQSELERTLRYLADLEGEQMDEML